MPICEIEGYGISWGPIKLSPILGPEIPVEKQGRKTQIDLTRDWHGESGTFAEMVDPQTVEVFEYSGVIKIEPPIRHLVGRQINRDRLTRGHLRWVKKVCSRIGWSAAEAVQLPGSSL